MPCLFALALFTCPRPALVHALFLRQPYQISVSEKEYIEEREKPQHILYPGGEGKIKKIRRKCATVAPYLLCTRLGSRSRPGSEGKKYGANAPQLHHIWTQAASGAMRQHLFPLSIFDGEGARGSDLDAQFSIRVTLDGPDTLLQAGSGL